MGNMQTSQDRTFAMLLTFAARAVGAPVITLAAATLASGWAHASAKVLVRGEGVSFAAQITGLQRVRLAAGEACGQLRLARERGHARRSHYYGDNAQFFVLHAAVEIVCGGHRAHRRGLVQLRVLVGHLDQSGLLGGGSTVAWGRRGDRARLHVLINLRPQGRRRSAMWRTRRTRVAQAAGVVQAGVVRTGRHDAGGRAADGVRGTLWVQKERHC